MFKFIVLVLHLARIGFFIWYGIYVYKLYPEQLDEATFHLVLLGLLILGAQIDNLSNKLNKSL